MITTKYVPMPFGFIEQLSRIGVQVVDPERVACRYGVYRANGMWGDTRVQITACEICGQAVISVELDGECLAGWDASLNNEWRVYAVHKQI